MGAIADELAAVAAALTGAGIPATTDPAAVWGLAAGNDTAALIGRLDSVELVSAKPRLRFTVGVTLVSRGTDDHGETRLLDALPAALQALHPAEPGRPDRLTRADANMPAYLIPVTRTIPC